MKKKVTFFALLAGCAGITLADAQTNPTINTANRFAWGENIGWTDWRYDTGAPGKGATG